MTGALIAMLVVLAIGAVLGGLYLFLGWAGPFHDRDKPTYPE